MKVILTEVVKYLGEPGEVKDVANGYARNYLLPRHMAVAATPGALKQINERKAAEGRRIAKAEEENRALATTIEQQTIHIKARVGTHGRLYGSVTSSDIAHALSQQLGQEIDRRKVELDENIHQVGTYQVPVRLVGRLVPRVNVVVESDETSATPSVAPATAPAEETEQAATSEVVTSSELQDAVE
jgi:large subunit ribosomal protein L9